MPSCGSLAKVAARLNLVRRVNWGGGWTPHDLRRTGATMMGELGIMGEVIERCLNHVEGNKLKRIYQRHELKAEQREAWRLLGDRLALLQSADAHENVVVGRFTQRA